MEFKQNKFLSAEKQIVTANPDINIVRVYYFIHLFCFTMSVDFLVSIVLIIKQVVI